MNEPLDVPANYNLTLMTLFGLLSGIGLTFLFQDIFTVSLTKALLIAIASSCIWLIFYIIKNYQDSAIRAKEVLALIAIFAISGALIWYKLPPLVDYMIPWQIPLIWLVSFGVVYKIEASLMAPQGDVDVFHKGTDQHGTDQRIAFHDLPKKQILNEEVAFHIDNDGLDLQIIFNVEKTGAPVLIKVDQISDNARFKDYLLKQGITVNELGRVIDGAMLIEIELDESVAYYQVVENFSYGEPELLPAINIALLENSDVLNRAIETALQEMLVDYPAESVKKYNTKNYQAVFKFYDYVKKLNKKENRCIDYISFYHGRFEISNSEYVELYNCNLHSTLISWINKDGLIRTDYVDEEEGLLTPSEKEALQTIVGLPFVQCRLIDIKLHKQSKNSATVKLYMTFAELSDYEPTGKYESLTLSAKGKDIMISSEIQDEDDLITIDEYFDTKTLLSFNPEDEKVQQQVTGIDEIDSDYVIPVDFAAEQASIIDMLDGKGVAPSAREEFVTEVGDPAPTDPVAADISPVESTSIINQPDDNEFVPLTQKVQVQETAQLDNDYVISEGFADEQSSIIDMLDGKEFIPLTQQEQVTESDDIGTTETILTDLPSEEPTSIINQRDDNEFAPLALAVEDKVTENDELANADTIPVDLSLAESNAIIDQLDDNDFAPLVLDLEEQITEIEALDSDGDVSATLTVAEQTPELDELATEIEQLEDGEFDLQMEDLDDDESAPLTLELEALSNEIEELDGEEFTPIVLADDSEVEQLEDGEFDLQMEALDDDESAPLTLELEALSNEIEELDGEEFTPIVLADDSEVEQLEDGEFDLQMEDLDDDDSAPLTLELEALSDEIEELDGEEFTPIVLADDSEVEQLEEGEFDLQMEALDDDDSAPLTLEFEALSNEIEELDGEEFTPMVLADDSEVEQLEEGEFDLQMEALDDSAPLTLELEALSNEIEELDGEEFTPMMLANDSEVEQLEDGEFDLQMEALEGDEVAPLTLEHDELATEIQELDRDESNSLTLDLEDLAREVDERDVDKFTSSTFALEEPVENIEESTLDIEALEHDGVASLTLDLEDLSMEINELDDDALFVEKGLDKQVKVNEELDSYAFSPIPLLEGLASEVDELDGDELSSSTLELEEPTLDLEKLDDDKFSSLALDLEKMATKIDKLDNEKQDKKRKKKKKVQAIKEYEQSGKE